MFSLGLVIGIGLNIATLNRNINKVTELSVLVHTRGNTPVRYSWLLLYTLVITDYNDTPLVAM